MYYFEALRPIVCHLLAGESSGVAPKDRHAFCGWNCHPRMEHEYSNSMRLRPFAYSCLYSWMVFAPQRKNAYCHHKELRFFGSGKALAYSIND
jgi:hypothetical protein